MDLAFEWDPRKAASNLGKHGVSLEEAATAFGDPLGWITPDPRDFEGEERLVLLGRSERGRVLAVMFTEREAALRLISARSATRLERRSYEEEQD